MIMNEAPVAISDAPVVRNVLLLRVLIAGMTFPFRGLRFAFSFLTQRNPKEVSNSQNGGWDREVYGSVGTAWRVCRSENTKYRTRQLRSDFNVNRHLKDGQFVARGSMRLRSQFKEGIANLPDRLLSARRTVHSRLCLKW
jgi:hypothetical protein